MAERKKVQLIIQINPPHLLANSWSGWEIGQTESFDPNKTIKKKHFLYPTTILIKCLDSLNHSIDLEVNFVGASCLGVLCFGGRYGHFSAIVPFRLLSSPL